jgi:hypothetical protein
MIWHTENLKDYDDGHEISMYESYTPPDIMLLEQDIIAIARLKKFHNTAGRNDNQIALDCLRFFRHKLIYTYELDNCWNPRQCKQYIKAGIITQEMTFKLDYAAGLDPNTAESKYSLFPILQTKLTSEFWDEFMSLVQSNPREEEILHVNMFNVKGKKSKTLFSSSDGEVDNNSLHRTTQVNKTSKIINNDEDEEEIEKMQQNLTQRLKDNNIKNNFDYFDDEYPGNNIQNSNNVRRNNNNNFEKFTVGDDTSEDDESYNIFGSTKLRTNVKKKLPEMQNPPPVLPSSATTTITQENHITTGDNTNTILAHLTAMFKESTAQTEKKLDQFQGNLQSSIDDQNIKTNTKIQILEDTITVKLNDHTDQIHNLVALSNEQLKLELNISIEDKVKAGSAQISERIFKIENDNKKQNDLVHKLLNSDAQKEKLLTPQREDDCRWNDLVPDEAVIGWQEEYTQALKDATAKNGGTFTLPSLTRKIELGI